jgi:hypothetical protein
MKTTIRKEVFETNSSSQHSLSILTSSEYNLWKEGKTAARVEFIEPWCDGTITGFISIDSEEYLKQQLHKTGKSDKWRNDIWADRDGNETLERTKQRYYSYDEYIGYVDRYNELIFSPVAVERKKGKTH